MTEMFNNNADKGAVEERVSRAADDKNGGTCTCTTRSSNPDEIEKQRHIHRRDKKERHHHRHHRTRNSRHSAAKEACRIDSRKYEANLNSEDNEVTRNNSIMDSRPAVAIMKGSHVNVLHANEDSQPPATPSLGIMTLSSASKDDVAADASNDHTLYPGAVAVPGLCSTAPGDEFNSVAPPPTPPPSHQNALVPISAHMVTESDEDLEILQRQLRERDYQLQRVLEERENVAVAQVIVDEPFMVRVQKSIRHPCGPRMRWVSLSIAILVILGIVLGLVLSPTDEMEPITTTSVEALIDLLSSKSIDGGVALRTPSTHQNEALTWFAESAGLGTLSDRRIIQRYALATLYFSTNGGNWTNNTGWLSDTNECDWHNTAEETPFCSTDKAILNLALKSNNLDGTVPEEVGLLSGSLTDIFFRDETLKGTIPSALGLLTKLTHMYLGLNGFTGTIPTEIFQLNALEDFSIYNNELSGSIPTIVGQLTKLDTVSLFKNNFSGSIPSTIGLLTLLDSFDLSENDLTNSIPVEIGRLTRLNLLSLWKNKLVGRIPSEIGLLTALTDLWLSYNNLEGAVPTEILLLTNLESLGLNGNNASLTSDFSCPEFITSCAVD
jgi:hypothetical protein